MMAGLPLRQPGPVQLVGFSSPASLVFWPQDKQQLLLPVISITQLTTYLPGIFGATHTKGSKGGVDQLGASVISLRVEALSLSLSSCGIADKAGRVLSCFVRELELRFTAGRAIRRSDVR